ncbi:MAG: HDOD domain-containing protein [Pseudomonadota bacterium]
MIVFAREPVFAPDGHVFAYQINIGQSYQESLLKGAITDPTNERQAHVTWSDLLNGFVSILNISGNVLMQELPQDIVPEDTLFEIDSTTNTSILMKRLVELKTQGFRFVASEAFEPDENVLPLIDYVKVKPSPTTNDKSSVRKTMFNKHNVKSIAVDIHDQASYELARNEGYDFYQGFFFLEREKKQSDDLPANKLNVLRLLTEINNDELDINKLEKVFEQDATLSYLLFRYINNPMVNKYQKILSIRHALSYLGEVMIKKFIAIVSLTHMNAGNTPELLQVSLVRAKFCELVSTKMQPSADPTIAFLIGLFSLIDVILGRDMAFLMTKVALPDEIKNTLLTKQGVLYLLIKASRGLESAHWDSILAALDSMKMSSTELNGYYVQAVKWANDSGIPDSSDFPLKKTTP